MKIQLSKQFLVNTAISIVLLASLACATNPDLLITPSKNPTSQMDQKTPGKTIAEKQAELLTKDRGC